MSRRDTVVNDNCVTIYSTQPGTDARRFAAELDRGDDHVRRVMSNGLVYATVWLVSDGDNFYWSPPEGYAIDEVYVTGTGDTAVDVVQVDT